jgi:hypothetical protein
VGLPKFEGIVLMLTAAAALCLLIREAEEATNILPTKVLGLKDSLKSESEIGGYNGSLSS